MLTECTVLFFYQTIENDIKIPIKPVSKNEKPFCTVNQ